MTKLSYRECASRDHQLILSPITPTRHVVACVGQWNQAQEDK
jgi:hypothetical protein